MSENRIAAGIEVMTLTGLIQDKLDGIAISDSWGVEVANLLIREGELRRLSDIHISFQSQRAVVRGRRDGSLILLCSAAKPQGELLAARLKVMASLPTFQKHSPQDGRIVLSKDSGGIAKYLRVSFLPTIHGENVVIRFPEDSNCRGLGLEDLGMSDILRAAAVSLIGRREGALFVTGPGSSGKTTTMYALLRYLNDQFGDRMNILTIEDPVERDLDFAGQVQVNNLHDLSFAQALRSVLRQDPNVIMIGEVRDHETASIALQAGMSGHLVLSTLHAGRAFRVYGRLLSMNIDPYLIATAVTGAISQRLVRVQCSACGGDGCVRCEGTGSLRRTGIFEICPADENLRELVMARASADKLAEYALSIQAGNIITEADRMYREGMISADERAFVSAGESMYGQPTIG